MSKIQDCSDLIIEIMTYSSNDDTIRVESKLNSVIESMLIFLDYDDLIEILDNRVRPRLLPTKLIIWGDYINNKISDLKLWIRN
jgi:hypothetical protein